MARKRTKKEAKERIDDLPILPPIPTPVRPYIPAPIRALYLLQRPAKALAKVIVDADPLNRLEDETTTAERLEAGKEAFEILVNDPNIKMGAEELQMINDDNVKVVRTGNGSIPIDTGLSTIRSSRQFSPRNILLGTDVAPAKRTRKKTKTDKNMSKALREANDRLRTKNGKLRKGKSQADVMRLAHRLRKKM